MPEVNWIAVIAAGLSAMVLGGLWYSPLLFQKAWQRGAGISDEEMKTNAGHPAIVFGGSTLISIAAAFVFAMFLGPKPSLIFGLGAGASAGLFWVAGSFAINYLFERKSMTLFLVNGGYHTIQFTLYGLILSVLG